MKFETREQFTGLEIFTILVMG